MSRRLERARALWRWTGDERPPWAEEPGPGQESVWDFPRPPRVESVPEPIRVVADHVTLCETRSALRVLETASPPTVYLPRTDIDEALLVEAPGSSHCEWKGLARYWSVQSSDRLFDAVGWEYDRPHREYAELADHLSFYPGRLECWWGDERVAPQPGRFYGGWMTSRLAGPVKGDPGSEGW